MKKCMKKNIEIAMKNYGCFVQQQKSFADFSAGLSKKMGISQLRS